VVHGLRHHPADEALRVELARACWNLGRPELLVTKSEELVRLQPDWSECHWYLGYSLVLFAESMRRRNEPDAAIAAYQRAETAFARAMQIEPNFRDSSQHYLGMCALGRGFAHMIANRRSDAAQCVVELAGVRPEALAQRDGLEREGVDLIDTVLEWRRSGASPVDAIAWLDQLERANPGNAVWARSIADTELREGLRAFGRNAQEEGDAYLAASLEAARRAVRADASNANKRALAQTATVIAERGLERGSDPAIARALLDEAAPLVGLAPLPANARIEALRELAAAIRKELGAARPVFRPGR
jgi:hypothetical protein